MTTVDLDTLAWLVCGREGRGRAGRRIQDCDQAVLGNAGGVKPKCELANHRTSAVYEYLGLHELL